MVLMELMKFSVSFGTSGSRQPIRDSKRTEEMPKREQIRVNKLWKQIEYRNLSVFCLTI